MDRRAFIGGIAAFLTGGTLLYVQPAEERIDDLEQKAEALDERVSALETVVADESTGKADATGDKMNEAASDADVVEIEGEGKTVSDKFELSAGQYRVTATVDLAAGGVQVSGFTVYIYPPAGVPALVFNELIQNTGFWEGSAVYSAAEAGEYYVGVEGTTSPWTLAFELI